MLLTCWNVAGRVTRLGGQSKRVLGTGADVVCLQELTPSTSPLWERALRDAGYTSLVAGGGSARARPLSVLIAARSGLEPVPVRDVPWPERVLAARCPDGTEIVNVHSPTSPKPDLAKVRTHEAVFAHLARRDPRRLRVLCGDLNTPRREHADGTVWTFARDRWGRLRQERGERWDRAELALLRGLERSGFRDAFRELHGHDRRELSWEWARWGGGYRLDHLLVSGPWRVIRCEYEHGWRQDGLSDHSPLLAELAPAD